jgi:hypothetical protein
VSYGGLQYEYTFAFQPTGLPAHGEAPQGDEVWRAFTLSLGRET